MTGGSRASDDASARRWIAFANLIDWMGTGVWITVSALYFSRIVGLTGPQVGLGLTLGGLCGLAAVVPVSAAARRWPVRRLSVGLHLFRGAALGCYLFVDSFPGFVLVACMTSIGERPAAALNQVLVARALTAEARAPAMALLHVTINVGITAGAAIGGLALLSDSSAGYTAVILGNAASSVLAATAIALMPTSAADRPAGDRSERRWVVLGVLRDRRYAGATIGLGLLALHVPLLNVVVPLWTARQTSVPIALVGPLFVVNTLLVVLLQVPASRRVRSVHAGRLAATAAGGALVGAAACMACAAAAGDAVAIALVGCGVVLLTLGEIGHGAAAWALSFGLAPEDDRQPAYLGCFGMGTATATVVGPWLLTALTLGVGGLGWFLFGALVATGVGIVWAAVPRQGDAAPATDHDPELAADAP